MTMKLVFTFFALVAAATPEPSQPSQLDFPDVGLGVPALHDAEILVRTLKKKDVPAAQDVFVRAVRTADKASTPGKQAKKDAMGDQSKKVEKGRNKVKKIHTKTSKKAKKKSGGSNSKKSGNTRKNASAKATKKKSGKKMSGNASKKKSVKTNKKKAGKANKKNSRKAGHNKSGQNGKKKSKKARKQKSGKASKKSSGKTGKLKFGKVTKKKSKTDSKKKSGGGSKNKSAQSTSSSRQSTCNETDVVSAIKKYILATTNINQNKRIKSFISQSQSKANKAPTVFQTALSALADSTGKGASCNGAAANTSISTIYNKLTNCSSTAASLCNVQLSAADNTTVTNCATTLTTFVTAFQACVTSGSCSCFQSLGSISASCTNHSAILAPIATQKGQCLGSTVPGSFLDCRQQQMNVVGYTTACKCPGPGTNTNPTATTKAAGRLVRSRDLFRFKKLNL